MPSCVYVIKHIILIDMIKYMFCIYIAIFTFSNLFQKLNINIIVGRYLHFGVACFPTTTWARRLMTEEKRNRSCVSIYIDHVVVIFKRLVGAYNSRHTGNI